MDFVEDILPILTKIRTRKPISPRKRRLLLQKAKRYGMIDSEGNPTPQTKIIMKKIIGDFS